MEKNKESKILIVDDDNIVRDFLRKFLSSKGFTQLESASTGQEALKIIEEKKQNIKLVLLDIRLPDINGVDLLRRIKEINKDIGVIMITAFADEEKAKEAMRLGAFDYIMKPFDLAYLQLSVLTKIATAI
ncbi:MAG: response regulator [Candidatus Omnitrophica bacterium]|nr:response regulator [Candidatus Omnitrophota bacterium]